MKDLSLIPTNKSTEEQLLYEAVQSLLNGKRKAVTADDLIGTGWFEWDPAGTLRLGRSVEGLKKQVLDHDMDISIWTSAMQSLQSSVKEVQGGVVAQNRDITELQTHMELVRRRGDQIAGRIELDAKANREILSRVTATNDLIEVLSQATTELQATAAVSEGTLSFLNNGVEVNAAANASLTARVTVAEGKIEAIAEDVVDLQASVNVLPRVFLQPSQPTSGQGPFVVGDMWLDSDDGNKVRVWDGSVWSESIDLVGATIYAQTTAPVSAGLRVGDMWFDTDDNNRQYRWSGTQWVDVTNPVIEATATALNQLDARVVLTEQGLVTQSAQITTLQNTVAGKADSSAVNALSSQVSTMGGQLTSQGSAITSLQNTIDDPTSGLGSKASASALDSLSTTVTQQGAQITAVANRTTTVEARMPAGTGTLGTAADVTAAQAAAQAASDKAGNKGEVIYGSTAPSADKRLAQNLWIDTTGNANTPKRWNGSVWVAVTDKAATDAAAAAAAALSHSQGVDARVTTVESASVSRDNALSSRTSVVEARMPAGNGELATAGALTATQAQVDSQGTAIGTLTGQVTAANTAANQAVSATEELRVVVNNSPAEIVRNGVATPARGRERWGSNVTVVTSGAHPTGHMFRVENGGAFEGNFASAVPCAPGDVFDVSVDVNGFLMTTGAWGAIGIQFYDKAGTSLGTLAIPGTSPTVGQGWEYAKTGVTPAAPAGAARCCALMFCTDNGGGAAAFNNLSIVKRGVIGATAAASHTVALDVNGFISGTQSMNNGTISSFNIRADVFQISAPSGGARTEYSNGHWRVYDAAGGLRVKLGVWP